MGEYTEYILLIFWARWIIFIDKYVLEVFSYTNSNFNET